MNKNHEISDEKKLKELLINTIKEYYNVTKQDEIYHKLLEMELIIVEKKNIFNSENPFQKGKVDMLIKHLRKKFNEEEDVTSLSIINENDDAEFVQNLNNSFKKERGFQIKLNPDSEGKC